MNRFRTLVARDLRLALRQGSDATIAVMFFVLCVVLFPFGVGPEPNILARIAAVGAEAASARYGHEIGECGICGRQLTNDESRARGIGPVCAAKAGW